MEFGKYTLISKIGAGGMAEVFKAHPTKVPDRILAIKRILPQYSRNKELVSMLVNEAGVSVMLSHPNIVPVIDFGMVGDTYFIAMEYIYGRDLKSVIIELLRKKQPVPIPLAIHIMIQVLRGLDYAHHKTDQFQRPLQIVHRDISPQNIILSFSGQVKILDFGIAKITAKPDESEAGLLKGKFSYMSPEQAYGKEIDPRTDIYSAGLVLWELLTAKNCFTGKSDIEILHKVRKAKISPPHDVNDRVALDISQIVMRALEKKIKNRYITAGQFADALEHFQIERFGRITETDVAALLRTIFASHVSDTTQESGFETESLENTLGKIQMESNSEIENTRDDSIPRIKTKAEDAPWVKKNKVEIPLYIKLLGIYLLVGLLLQVKPLNKFTQLVDDKISLAASVVRERLNFSSSKDVKPINIPEFKIPKSVYSIHLSRSAQEILDELPFDRFESIRNHILDLGNKPFPKGKSPTSGGKQNFSSVQSGYRIRYFVDEDKRHVVIQSIRES